MAIFHCELCGNLLDGDWVESYEWGDGEVCIDCHVEHTPEDWEDYNLYRDSSFPAAFRWTLCHKDYDGAPIHSFGPPADGRFFMGPTIEDVYQQAIEYNEEIAEKAKNFDPMDDGDYAYDNWKDKQMEKEHD